MSEIEEFVFTLKNDYAFKRLLGAEENKAILQDFLACVLDIPHENFADCKLLDKELNKDAKEEKTGILDIKIRLKDRTYIDMEMQFMWDDSFVLRSIFYVAKMYIEDFRTGSSYSKLHKCISINVIAEGYNLDDEIHSKYYLINPKTQKKLTDAIEFHFLNLEKVRELPIEYGNTKENLLINWLKFIDASTQKERNMLANTSPVLKILNEKRVKLNLSPEEKRLYESRMKLKSDIVTIYESSFNKGIRQGIEKGLKEGIEKGIEKGIEEGSYNAKLETARNLIDMGLSREDVCKATGLSKEEIDKVIAL